MIFDFIPKVNIALGAVVVLCFFLPWLSIDCGDVTVARASGFQLSLGKSSVNEAQLEALSAEYGRREDPNLPDDPLSPGNRSRPKLYLFAVLLCGGAILWYGYKMIESMRLVEIFGVMIPGAAGTLFMIIFAAADFGVPLPSDTSVLIQVNAQVGFYGTLIGFLAAAVLGYISYRNYSPKEPVVEATEGPSPKFVPVEATIIDMEDRAPGVEDIVIAETPLEKALELPQVYEGPEEKKKPAPPKGAKLCPHCESVVGPFQTKCMKCGSALKPGKR